MQEYSEQVGPAIVSIRDAAEGLIGVIRMSRSETGQAAEAEALGEMEDSVYELRAARDVLMDGRPPTPSLSRLHVDLLGSVIDALESGTICLLDTRQLFEQSSVSRADRAQSGRLGTSWSKDMGDVVRAVEAWYAEWRRQFTKAGLPPPAWVTE